MQAQSEATRIAEREIHRLIEKYGKETMVTAFSEVQDYVETLTRQRVARLLRMARGKTEDYIDVDPALGEGLIPIHVKMTIDDDTIHYDLSGSHPKSLSTFLNTCFGGAFAAIVAGTKIQFPDIPLNSGFYRVVTVDLGPPGSVVNAVWPTPAAGFCSGPFEKIMNAIFELWAELLPERAHGLHLQPRVPARRWPRWPLRGSAVLHVVRLDGRRLGCPQRPATAGAATGPVFGVQLGDPAVRGPRAARLGP